MITEFSETPFRQTNLGPKPRKTPQNHEANPRNWDDEKGVQFRVHQGKDFILKDHADDGGDESGVCSPPLWKNSPSPPKSPSQPLLNYRALSPASRTQAIVRGQWELMEMVKNMPESSYELSLKDLVENPRLMEGQVQVQEEKKDQILQQRAKRVEPKKNDLNNNRAKIGRTGSMDNRGLYLNMVYPTSFNSRKNKKNSNNNNSNNSSVNSKVPPSSTSVERDWWKKKFTGSSDSDSSRTSSSYYNSGSTGSSGSSSSGHSFSGRRRRGYLASCWPCFCERQRESAE